MWIAFRIVFLLMIPNYNNVKTTNRAVVNCFQNCIFTYDSQHLLMLSINNTRCELLSELYFYLWFPTNVYHFTWFERLWIAFRIVFLLMIPNNLVSRIFPHNVVNCFQNCIFTYDSQRSWQNPSTKQRCELLSELYFYLWFPTHNHYRKRRLPLWIAFRIVFLLMIPNESLNINSKPSVVNCFQNCIFTYDSQLEHLPSHPPTRCELLSELYFYLWFPTHR